jgi:2-methylcitrate dehydratase PrpD
VSGSSSATPAVIDFIDQVRFDDFPDEAVRIAKNCIIDGIGVMLAGSTQRAGEIVRDLAAEAGTKAEATIFGRVPMTASVSYAALANGTSGHALDWDDTQLATTADRIFGLLTHPTIPPLVATLALGEHLGHSGRTMLEAFLTGFEVECKIAEAISPAHYMKGFHTSGTIGTFGASVAAAKLLDLQKDQIAHMLAIAASSSSGIRVNFGSMTKPLHVGRAAQNGIVAAQLAARGFTGGADALDPPWGFFASFSHGEGFDSHRIVGKLGNPHTIVWPGVSIKPYPCGVLGHPTMDAMRRLVIDNDVKPDDIVAIRVRAGTNILNPLRYDIANNELEAKFCPAFMVSAIALRRKAGIHEFNDDFVCSEPVQAMMKKVDRVLDKDIEAQGWEKIRSIVEVDLADGRTLVQKADERYRGGPDLPFTREDLFEKFSDCATLLLSPERIADVFFRLERLEEVGNVREVVELLKPDAAT